jgi:hypothetical protein
MSRSNSLIGFGWLPDVPSTKDFTVETPDVAKLVSRTKSARMFGAVSSTHSAAAPAPALAPAVEPT